jgi:hypothetical protein
VGFSPKGSPAKRGSDQIEPRSSRLPYRIAFASILDFVPTDNGVFNLVPQNEVLNILKGETSLAIMRDATSLQKLGERLMSTRTSTGVNCTYHRERPIFDSQRIVDAKPKK